MLLTSLPLAADWEKFSDQATVVGVGVALMVGIATTVVMIRQEKATRDGQRIQQQQAVTAAERSEAAARLTEEYTRRVVEALETMAAHRPGRLSTPLDSPSVRWSLVHHQGDAYRLENVGSAEADDVSVAAHRTMILRAPEPQALRPGEALTFIAARSMATSDSTITVRWATRGNAEEQSWRYPLPMRGSSR